MKNLFARHPTPSPADTPIAETRSAVMVPTPGPSASVLTAPVTLESASGTGAAVLKLESALRVGNHVVVAGWLLGAVDVAIGDADADVAQQRAWRFPRADVADHFERPEAEQHGFALVIASDPMATHVTLVAQTPSGARYEEHVELVDVRAADLASLSMLGPALAIAVLGLEPYSEDWRHWVARLQPRAHVSPHARGHLESAIAVHSIRQAVVVGWMVHDHESQVWIEDDAGGLHPVAGSMGTLRRDVHAVLGDEFGAAALHSGFLLHIESRRPTSLLRLRALTPDGLITLGEVPCQPMPADPKAVSRWLFGIGAPEGGLEQRFIDVEQPLIGGLLARAHVQWGDMPVIRRRLGPPPAAPRVSVIVPLYGRYDFVESQMVEWARDRWMREHAELVYVVDDPALAEPFRIHAEELYRLYGVPFQWVWGSVNRGFSGANNLGAAHAAAPYLMFLNSDVFPQRPGWLASMIEALEADPACGAVGPRLTFADGGIQHAGMRFERLEEFGVWINRHPLAGLDPSLDPAHGPTPVPAITGACMLLSREDFDAVGGWDTGYLIGDFEDSDLCLKLRERGMAITYLPDVQLTHLERQSMSALGDSDYRMRVTLWNAMRHQGRWRHMIEQDMELRA